MRIAQIAPLAEAVPPKTYGGTERVVHALTEELVRRGHEVTLFASGDSRTSARLVSVHPTALRAQRKDLYGQTIWNLLNIGYAYQYQDEFDIIHDHNGHLSLPTAQNSRTPVLLTLHGALTEDKRIIFKYLNKPHVASISRAQAAVEGANYVGTVYNGLDMAGYPFSADHDGYLLFVGRIARRKGVHHAIHVAQTLHLPLTIAAKLDEADHLYFERSVQPHLSDKIRWIGEVTETERNALMTRAMCFLHPAMWREPFGLTLIEAMACGCPVVALNRGAIPEIVFNGKNGFVAGTVEEMIHAVNHIAAIDRQACREYVMERFSAGKMADAYERLYGKILSGEFEALPKFRHTKATLNGNGAPRIVENGNGKGKTLHSAVLSNTAP